MKPTKVSRRSRIEKRLASYCQHVRSYAPAAPDVFICPTCSQGASVKVLLDNLHAVSDGHVTPKSLGGRAKVLECTRCNSTHGSWGDAALKRRMDQVGFGTTHEVATDVYLTVGEIKIPVRWSADGDDNQLVIARNFPADRAERAFSELCKSGAPQLTLQLSSDTDGKAAMGHLHMAHLAMFRAFGYEYLFSAGGQKCVQLLSLKSLPEWRTQLRALVPDPAWRLGKICIVACEKRAAYGVCTWVASDQVGILMLPELQTGQLPDFVSHASTERLRIHIVADPGYFARHTPEQIKWRAHYMLTRLTSGSGLAAIADGGAEPGANTQPQ